jgi:hypothetical protein
VTARKIRRASSLPEITRIDAGFAMNRVQEFAAVFRFSTGAGRHRRDLVDARLSASLT